MLLQLPSSSRVPALYPTTAQGAQTGAELYTSDGRTLSLASARLHGVAQGGIARLVLEQHFANEHAETLRVTYRMPLPADAAISGYEFEISDRTIRGVVDRKRAARERFERAIAQGHTAALLEQERADIFTQQVGNIPPRESVRVRITIDQRLVWLPEGEWELRFPTVIGPRYSTTTEDARATHLKVSDRPLMARMQIELAIRDAIVAGAKPSSPSHQLDQRSDGTIALTSGARLDRDIVVRWPVATPTVGLALASARPQHGNDAFGLLTIVPPARAANAAPVPRDLIVLLDTSGSMGGGPLDKAKQVVALMIDSLDQRDRLEIIEFSNEPRRYLPEPIVATAAAKQAAIRWVRSRVADGGTEMRAAVIEALATLRIGAQRQVVVVTDGYVGGEHQILEALNRRLPASCRLHVLGVGSAVNRSLATSLSRAGRGTEVIVGLDEDVERAAKRLLDRTRLPMLTNVEITGSAVMRHAPARVPDVFAGAPLVCALGLRADGGELLVRGQLADGTWEERLTVAPLRAGDGNQAVVALYGRERVADVEATALFASVDGEIEELGLTFQIATRLTSWVAVDESRVVKGPTRDELIPQELPYGTKASAFGLRAQLESEPDLTEAYATPPSLSQGMWSGGDKTIILSARRAMQRERHEDVTVTGGAPSFDDASDDFGEAAPSEVDDFESELPTGQAFEKSALVPLAEQPMTDAPAPEMPKRADSQLLAPPPAAPAPRRPAPLPAAPEPSAKLGAAGPGALRGKTTSGARRTDLARMQAMTPKPELAKQRAPRWLMLAAVIAVVIALLLWWLL